MEKEHVTVTLNPAVQITSLTTTGSCIVEGFFTAADGANINNDLTVSATLTVGTISPPISGGLILNGYGTTKIALGNSVTVTGNVAMSGYTFASGMVSAAGAKVTSTGQVGWSSSLSSAGLHLITFNSAHPLGANYIINVTSQGGAAAIRGSTYAPTSTTFQVACAAFGSTSVANSPFYFMILT